MVSIFVHFVDTGGNSFMNRQTVGGRRRHRDGVYHLEPIVEDGEEITVPLHLCDTMRRDVVLSFGTLASADAAALHRPGFRLFDTAGRDRVRAAREEMIDRAANAWKMDRRKVDPDEDDDDDDDDEANLRHESPSTDVRAPAVSARDAYVRSLSTAYLRGPVRDALEPGPGPAATLPAPRAGASPQRPVPPPQDPQRRKDEAYASYAASLSEAWKMAPQTVLVGAGTISHIARAGEVERAGLIERELEATRGGP
jgi:hypothetical protein